MLNNIKSIMGSCVRLFSGFSQPNTDNIDVQIEKFKVTARLVPALLLGNIFLASVAFITIETADIAVYKNFAYLAVCILCFGGLLSWHKAPFVASSTNRVAPKVGIKRAYMALALALGSLWSLLPPAITSINSGQEIVVASAILAGLFCVSSFALTPMPMVAVLFLTPILISCFSALWMAGSQHSEILAVALTLYIAFIGSIALNFTRSMVNVVISGKEVSKHQKTISLLLRDFEKQSSDWLWEIDADNRFVRVSERFSEVAGYTTIKLGQMRITDMIVPNNDSGPGPSILLGAIQRKVSFTDVQVPVLVKGEIFWWSMTGTPNFDDKGIFTGYHGVSSDITLQKKANERINFLAHHDILTSLYNRAHFTELLNQNVSRLERYGAPFALLFLDLDYFKAINDSYGHPMGDKVLIEVSARLRNVLKQNAAIARLGGDEFAVIFQKSVPFSQMKKIASQILEAIAQPLEIEGERLQIGVSIGIAFAPHHGTRPDQLLRNVDLALYRAKESGRNAYRVFESGMDSLARERRALEFDLRQALEANELELSYQPLVSAQDNRPVGFEALLRWNHPIRGAISPAEFVPIAESTGLIRSIGEWAIREACRVAATWPEHLTVAVNLSAPQFSKDRIVEVVAEALLDSGLKPNRLELEITESLLIDRPDEAIATLNRLKDLGVSIAMDDFGTGYSSLSYLLKFPFDKIKIDKSFISAINTDKAACDVLRTIGSLGKSLNVKITAEGVETIEQAEFLRAISCDQLQGYLFSKALHVDDVAAFLLTNLKNNLAVKVGASTKSRTIAA